MLEEHLGCEVDPDKECVLCDANCPAIRAVCENIPGNKGLGIKMCIDVVIPSL